MDTSLLIIRADASSRIGAGHVMRCLAIAQAWSDEGGKVEFVSGELPVTLNDRIITEGFKCTSVDSVTGTLADAKELASLAMARNARAVVLDGYHFDERYHAVIAQSITVTLAIDDDARLPHYSSRFVLNQNLGATEEAYPNIDQHTQLLLGTQYALLRREFLQSNPGRQFGSLEKQSFRCLVTLGGSDPGNVTANAIRGLQLLDDDHMEVRVIIGGLNPHGDDLAKVISGDKRFCLLRNVVNMAAEYAWANFAIAAGGSSNWEMCYFGLPRLLFVIADNQRAIAEQLHQAQVAINVGEGPDILPERIAKALNAFRIDHGRLSVARQQGTRLVDGFGAKRTVDRLLGASEPTNPNH